MPDACLVLNAGSSSLKFALFRLDGANIEPLLNGQLAGIDTAARFSARTAAGEQLDQRTWDGPLAGGHTGAVEFVLNWLAADRMPGLTICGVVHRVVHGGCRFTEPVRIDDTVLEELTRLIPLAPLHQPHHLAAIRAVAARAPDWPQIACFDTSFHRTQPPLAQQFAIPRHLTDEGVIRYGFHGISFEYITSVAATFDPLGAAGRMIVAHLGNGSSLCAIQAGRSIATTMSFTPLDGLPMGTRCGAIDPGVLLYLLEQRGMTPAQVTDLLYHQSGLLGVSGISSDARTLRENDSPSAREAIDLLVYRIGREIGSLAAALGGLEMLVFTGGIGENAVSIREAICRSAAWLGLELDPAANAAGSPRISQPDSRVSAWVIPTNEELMLARHLQRLLPQ